jgi:hypothetical protein
MTRVVVKFGDILTWVRKLSIFSFNKFFRPSFFPVSLDARLFFPLLLTLLKKDLLIDGDGDACQSMSKT